MTATSFSDRVDRMLRALNAHDLDAWVAEFAPDYRGEQPAHPQRTLNGRDDLRARWRRIFDEVPDFRVELARWSTIGGLLWAEWRWLGSRRDGQPVNLCGVALFGVGDRGIEWGRLYMEPVRPGTDGPLDDLLGGG